MLRIYFALAGFIVGLSGVAHAKLNERAVFLNGVDISSAKHQILEGVTVRIDGTGQIFIEAPHYEVNEESTYIPLSTWSNETLGLPQHKKPTTMRGADAGIDRGLSRQLKNAKPIGKSTPRTSNKPRIPDDQPASALPDDQNQNREPNGQ
ncbi:MAG: hypothetical protein HRU19_10825 [Pseudobacteriovorax sp.]|nr:hypothetical protein [Pseudobacteriovorax sp.]